MNVSRKLRNVASLTAACLAVTLAGTAGAQSPSVPLDFVDVADDPLAPDFCGVDMVYGDPDLVFQTDGAGVSVADFDNDGLLDIYCPGAKKTVASKLYHNLGNLTFANEAAARGVADPMSASATAVFVDYDHDGDLDLAVSSHLGKPGFFMGPRYKLFRNGGAANGYVFVDVTFAAGFTTLPTPVPTTFGWVGGICAGDVNRDGYVDLLSTWNANSISPNDQCRLMRNMPNPTPGDPNDPSYTPRIFVDVTPGSNLEIDQSGDTWQPVLWDVDRDGWLDIHIAIDFSLDFMYRNNHDGTFTNVAPAAGLNGNPAEFRNEMGVAMGDIDNDLDQDMHLTNRSWLDRCYRNDSVAGALGFTDVAMQTGLNNSTFGWGDDFFDMDNDGDLDHAAVTSSAHDPNQVHVNPIYRNLYPQKLPDGITPAFEDLTNVLVDFSQRGATGGDRARGLASGDLDNDGDIDLVVSRDVGRYRVMKNTLASSSGWLEVNLVNTAGSLDTSNARVYLRQGSVIQMREQFTGSSFLCQDAPRLHFGLGAPVFIGPPVVTVGTGGLGIGQAQTAGIQTRTLNPPSWLVVRWPDFTCQIVMHPQRNAINTVVHSAVNDVGDMNADGHLTAVDQAMLLLATQNQAAFDAAYPLSPGLVVGDVDNNGVLDGSDLTAWTALPPH